MNKLSEQGEVILLGISALFLGVAHVFLFYEQGFGLNYPLFVTLVVVFGLLLARIFSRELWREHYVIIACSLFFASMVFIRSSELLTFFNVLGSLLLLLVAVSMFANRRLGSFIASDYLKVPFLPLRFIGPFFETFSAIISLKSVLGDNAKTKEIIRGSLMATLALTLFAWLFSSADAGFEKLLSSIFVFDIDQVLINKTFLGTIVTAFFIGAFGFMFRKIHASVAPTAVLKVRHLGAIETTILLGSINVLFFGFIILQVSYLFGGAAHLFAGGLTYAEYAREGFFQLVMVAILSFVIISFAEQQVIQDNGAHLRSFKILSGVLVFQVIVILVSAFTRLSLYEDAYGFTTIRLYSHAFMIWFGVLLSLLSLHIWKNGKRTDFSLRAFSSVVVLLFVMNVMNPDVFIAKKNLERYASTGQIDAGYLGSLSSDALPYTFHLLDDPNKEVRNSFARGLYEQYDHCRLDDCTSWRSSRFNRRAAEDLLAPQQDMINNVGSLYEYSSTGENL